MSTEPVLHKQSATATGHQPDVRHTVQLYRADEYLVKDLSRWMAIALKGGGSSVVIATKPHRAGIADHLQAAGIDVPREVARGRHIALDARETLAKIMRDGWPDAERFREVAGAVVDKAAAAARPLSPGVYAFGEMVAELWAEQKVQAAIRLEQLWNDLAQTHAFHLRCAYPVSQFGEQGDGEKFLRICGEHSHVISADAQRQKDSGTTSCRILSVSTNTRLLIMRNDTLAVAGYSVVSPKEPEEAAFLLATQPFDVIVIADSLRPKKRAALISALRSIRSDIPIIFVQAGPEDVSEPLADMSVDVRNGPMALISALQRNSARLTA